VWWQLALFLFLISSTISLSLSAAMLTLKSVMAADSLFVLTTSACKSEIRQHTSAYASRIPRLLELWTCICMP
jgi:hypothetical protein